MAGYGRPNMSVRPSTRSSRYAAASSRRQEQGLHGPRRTASAPIVSVNAATIVVGAMSPAATTSANPPDRRSRSTTGPPGRCSGPGCATAGLVSSRPAVISSRLASENENNPIQGVESLERRRRAHPPNPRPVATATRPSTRATRKSHVNSDPAVASDSTDHLERRGQVPFAPPRASPSAGAVVARWKLRRYQIPTAAPIPTTRQSGRQRRSTRRPTNTSTGHTSSPVASDSDATSPRATAGQTQPRHRTTMAPSTHRLAVNHATPLIDRVKFQEPCRVEEQDAGRHDEGGRRPGPAITGGDEPREDHQLGEHEDHGEGAQPEVRAVGEIDVRPVQEVGDGHRVLVVEHQQRTEVEPSAQGRRVGEIRQ